MNMDKVWKSRIFPLIALSDPETFPFNLTRDIPIISYLTYLKFEWKIVKVNTFSAVGA